MKINQVDVKIYMEHVKTTVFLIAVAIVTSYLSFANTCTIPTSLECLKMYYRLSTATGL